MNTNWLTLLFALCLFGSADIVNSLKCEAGTECLSLEDCQVYYEHLKKLHTTNPDQYVDFLMNNITSNKCGYKGIYPKVCCPVKENLMDVCGTFDSNKMYTTDGFPTKRLGYPWLALLQYNTSTGQRHGCGGVLISDRYVLTAAYCLSLGVDPVSVRLGEYNLNTDPDCFYKNLVPGYYCMPKFIEVGVESAIVHPEYTGMQGAGASFDTTHNIALVKLNQSVKFSESVKPICLPKRDYKDIGHEKYREVGWGVTPFAEFPKSTVKRQFRMKLANSTECFGADGWPMEDVICAKAMKTGVSCYGDYGGPLMVGESPRGWTVIGINTQSELIGDCWTNKVSNQYTDVTQYRDWIVNTIKH